MKRTFTRVTLLLLLFFTISSANVFAQTQTISEQDLSLSVLKWFYSKYPGIDGVEWSETKSKSGEKLYQAQFKLDGHDFTSIMNNAGKIMYENKEYDKKDSPVPILDHAESNFDKFKLVAVHKHTNYTYGALNTEETNYELIVKVNGEEQSIWFNEHMNRNDSFETSNLAVK